jgi:glycogen(starch) synthase
MSGLRIQRPRRVLMTADTVGGVWTYALELARALSSSEVEILLATLGAPPSQSQLQAASRLQNIRVVSASFRLEWMTDPWDDVARAGDWLLDLEQEHAPDIVHLNGYVHAALPWAAPRVVVAHSCVLSWWRATRGGDAPEKWGRYAEAVREGLLAADRVIAPTRAMLDALIAHYGPLPRAGVIYNARDASVFRPLPKDEFVLGAGRLWDEGKNVQALADVAPGLPWPVLLAGECQGPEGQRVSPGGAGLLGPVAESQMARLLGRAAIFAHPARYEPFGLCALEAALSGCALVLGNIPSLRELWEGVALFAPPNDKAALAHAITRLIRQPHELARRGQRARERALLLEPAAMAEAYLSVYEGVIASRALVGIGFQESRL